MNNTQLVKLLNEQQKRNKIRNLLYEMSKKDRTIQNSSKSSARPTWVLTRQKLDKE
jgi:ATP-dependent DNA helicase RecG